MRISTMQEQAGMLSSLQQANSQAFQDWNRLASGKKFNQPSDDPLSAVQLLEVNRRLGSTEIYQQNIAALNDLLKQEEIVLRSCIDNIGQARDIILKANNGAMDDLGLQALGQEVSHIIDSLVSLINTRDANGNYLFGGFHSSEQPVVIEKGELVVENDDLNRRSVMVTKSSRVIGPNTAQSLCFDIKNGKESFNLLEMLTAFKKQLMGTSTEPPAPFTDLLKKIDIAADNFNSAQTELGAKLSMLERTSDSHGQYKMFCQELAGNLGDLDYAATITHLNQSMVAMEAARKSLSVVSQVSLFQYL